MSVAKKTVVGVHDFDWLRTQAADEPTQKLVDKIIAIEESYMRGQPVPIGTGLMQLRLKQNVIWTRENTAHTIPYGYVQIFKLLDEILPEEFRQPMHHTILDVGANEGHWSLYMAAHNPDASIAAIEPNPVPLELMRKNFEANGVANVAVLPIAVGDVSGTVEMETLDNVTSVDSFKIDREGRPWLTDDKIRRISVPCRMLDDLDEAKNAQRIDLLKIDVEGAELAVLKGATETLPKVQRIEIEYGSDQNRAEVLQTLESNGFALLLDHPYSKGRGDLFLMRAQNAKV